MLQGVEEGDVRPCTVPVSRPGVSAKCFPSFSSTLTSPASSTAGCERLPTGSAAVREFDVLLGVLEELERPAAT